MDQNSDSFSDGVGWVGEKRLKLKHSLWKGFMRVRGVFCKGLFLEQDRSGSV